MTKYQRSKAQTKTTKSSGFVALRQKFAATTSYISKSEVLVALVVTLSVVVVGVSLGWENNKLIPSTPSTSARYMLEPQNHLSFLSNWDGPIYLSIARHGYDDSIQNNFFPLYPLAVHIVNVVVRSTLYSGLIVSWLSLVGAVYFYLKIVKRLFKVNDNIEALRAVLLFVLFPTGVFLLATYTESLFAFLMLASVYFALNRKLILTALFAALATATHANGIFVVILVGLILLEQKEKAAKILATMAAGCLGILSYMTFLYVYFQDPFEFIEAQKAHSWLTLNPLTLLSHTVTRNGFFLVLLIAAVVYWWSRRRSFSIYSFLYVCILFISSVGLSGFGRYTLMAFPLQLMFYDYFRDKKTGYAIVLAVSTVGWTYFLLQYAGGYTGG